jgi:Cu-Zn family superoxide dismutase
MKRTSIALLLVLLGGCSTFRQSPTTDNTAVADVVDAQGKAVGTANFVQLNDAVRIVLEVRGLPPGLKGVHIHETGTCDGPGFTTAGGHFNPENKQHGTLNPRGPHAGDLPNINIGSDGSGRMETASKQVSLVSGPTSLFDGDGSAIVIHAAQDDFQTDPTGNSGARIACGVIRKSDGPKK